MAVGKNKRLTKGGKKGQKKKIVDPFTRKEWYDVRAPVMFNTRAVCKTPVNKTAGRGRKYRSSDRSTKAMHTLFYVTLSSFSFAHSGTRIASDSLKGRVYEVSLADLQNDEVAFRKFRLICEDVQGRNCLTNFHGMKLTTDKTRSMVKKWQTMIEARVDGTLSIEAACVFCLDEISFRRDCKSCRIGVVVCRRCATFMETLRWDNFCNFGATLLGFGTVRPVKRPINWRNHFKCHKIVCHISYSEFK